MAETDVTPNSNLDPQGGDGGEPKTYTQEEFDSLMKERLSEAIVKTKNEEKAKYQKQISEKEEAAKKQAAFEKMSELEKYKAIAEDSQREHQALLDKIALGEQKDETRKLMQEKGLTDEFLDFVLVAKDADKTIERIDSLKKYIEAAVQKGVEARIPTIVPQQNKEKEGIDSDIDRLRRAAGLPPLK